MWWWRWWCETSEINENKIAVDGEFECEIIKKKRIIREGVKKACTMRKKDSLLYIINYNIQNTTHGKDI